MRAFALVLVGCAPEPAPALVWDTPECALEVEGGPGWVGCRVRLDVDGDRAKVQLVSDAAGSFRAPGHGWLSFDTSARALDGVAGVVVPEKVHYTDDAGVPFALSGSLQYSASFDVDEGWFELDGALLGLRSGGEPVAGDFHVSAGDYSDFSTNR